MNVTLTTTSGNERLDTLMQGLIALFELSFPERIRSYYLGGSSSDGTAVTHSSSVNSSDLDLYVIFRGVMEEAELKTFQQLVAASRLISGIQVDASAYAEDDLLGRSGSGVEQVNFMRGLLKIAAQHVYGEDIRKVLPDVSLQRYTLDIIESGVYHIGIPRQLKKLSFPLVTPLVFPLSYPDPVGEFYGYDAVPVRPDVPSGTRVFVAGAVWIATLLLALETGRYAGRKSQSIQLCKELLPDDWRAQLAVTINDVCKLAWGYALPERAEDRQHLHELSRQMLALENEYLSLCRDFLLSRIQVGDPGERPQIARILQSITYPDEKLLLNYQNDEA